MENVSSGDYEFLVKVHEMDGRMEGLEGLYQ